MTLTLFILAYLSCSTLGLLLLKSSLLGIHPDSPLSYLKLLLDIKFDIGFFLYAISFLLWIALLSKKDISYIYPIVIGLSYICIIASAIFLLKENFTTGKAIGSLFIGLGIIILFIEK